MGPRQPATGPGSPRTAPPPPTTRARRCAGPPPAHLTAGPQDAGRGPLRRPRGGRTLAALGLLRSPVADLVGEYVPVVRQALIAARRLPHGGGPGSRVRGKNAGVLPGTPVARSPVHLSAGGPGGTGGGEGCFGRSAEIRGGHRDFPPTASYSCSNKPVTCGNSGMKDSASPVHELWQALGRTRSRDLQDTLAQRKRLQLLTPTPPRREPSGIDAWERSHIAGGFLVRTALPVSSPLNHPAPAPTSAYATQ